MKLLDIYSLFLSLEFFVHIYNIPVRTTIYVFLISVFMPYFYNVFLHPKPNETHTYYVPYIFRPVYY